LYVSYEKNIQKLHFKPIKTKAILLQAWTGPEGSKRLRVANLKTRITWRW